MLLNVYADGTMRQGTLPDYSAVTVIKYDENLRRFMIVAEQNVTCNRLVPVAGFGQGWVLHINGVRVTQGGWYAVDKDGDRFVYIMGTYCLLLEVTQNAEYVGS